MPVFNHADYVIEMLRSIQTNTFQDWEVIAVDDGSAPEHYDQIAAFAHQDARIHYSKREHQLKGAQTCRNEGLQKAQGEFVCFFDSDDYIAPHGLAQRVEALRARPDLDFIVFRSASYRDGRFDPTPSFNTYGYPIFKDDVAAFCARKLPFIVWNNIYRRASLIEKGVTWDLNLRSLQDAQFNMQCLLAGMKYEYADAPPDYAYRHGVAGSISKKINSPEHLESNLYAVRTFYETVQKQFGHRYDRQLYQGAMQIYVTVLRSEAPRWFAQRLVTIVQRHSKTWGTCFALQVWFTTLLLRILPAKLARSIPLFFNLYAIRRFEQIWKPAAISKLLLLLFCFIPLVSSCAQSTSDRDHLYELAWNDEFNGENLDTLLWSKMKRVKGVRCFMHFTDDARFYEFKNGHLRLYARHNANYIPTDTAEYLTSGITSEGKIPIHYGKIEVRARVKGAQGTWPAIWTLPEEKGFRTTRSPFYTELDIMEYVDKNKFAYQTAHNAYTLRDRKNWYRPNHQHQSRIKFEKYNTYSVEILPEEVIFAVNGRETLRYPRLPEEEHQFHYGIASFLMLHMQVHPPKSWSAGTDPKTFPAYMDIDWVRVYKLKE